MLDHVPQWEPLPGIQPTIWPAWSLSVSLGVLKHAWLVPHLLTKARTLQIWDEPPTFASSTHHLSLMLATGGLAC